MTAKFNTNSRSGSWSKERTLLRLTAAEAPKRYSILEQLFSVVTNGFFGFKTAPRARFLNKSYSETLELVAGSWTTEISLNCKRE